MVHIQQRPFAVLGCAHCQLVTPTEPQNPAKVGHIQVDMWFETSGDSYKALELIYNWPEVRELLLEYLDNYNMEVYRRIYARCK